MKHYRHVTAFVVLVVILVAAFVGVAIVHLLHQTGVPMPLALLFGILPPCGLILSMVIYEAKDEDDDTLL